VRLSSADYYADHGVSHTVQGDVYDDVACAVSDLPPQRPENRGRRRLRRPFEEGVSLFQASPRPVVVCSYTCGFVAQPPGTPGYSHDYRIVAPILRFQELKDLGMSNGDLRRLNEDGGRQGFIYLPWPKEEKGQEDAAACLYRPSCVTQQLLDARPRLKRMTQKGLKLLHIRLIQVISPNLFPPDDEGLRDADLSDSWKTDFLET